MALDIIIQFVERKMPTNEFLKHLYENQQLEELLSEKLTFESYIGDNLYLYLIEQDMYNLEDLINSLGGLKRFLKSKQVEFEENDEELKLHSLLLSSQPNWVDLPSFYLQKLLELAGDKKGIELKKFLKEEIKKDSNV